MTAVRVNEAAIFACDRGAEWWSLFRIAHLPSRFTTLPGTANPMGCVVDVACDDREHAEWLVGAMVEHGIPARAVRVLP